MCWLFLREILWVIHTFITTPYQMIVSLALCQVYYFLSDEDNNIKTKTIKASSYLSLFKLRRSMAFHEWKAKKNNFNTAENLDFKLHFLKRQCWSAKSCNSWCTKTENKTSCFSCQLKVLQEISSLSFSWTFLHTCAVNLPAVNHSDDVNRYGTQFSGVETICRRVDREVALFKHQGVSFFFCSL